jgi:hypothetical protein
MGPLELLVVLLIFTLPVGCAVASAMIAKRKGYNEIGFGLLGFFFSIFALILILVLPDRSKPREVVLLNGRSDEDPHADS